MLSLHLNLNAYLIGGVPMVVMESTYLPLFNRMLTRPASVCSRVRVPSVFVMNALAPTELAKQ